MHRSLLVALFLGLLALCSGYVFELTVDPLVGEDIPDCQYGEIVSNTITPNATCQSISYAIKRVSQTDSVTLTLKKGTYSGANNIGITFNSQVDVVGEDDTGPNAIIDCANTPMTSAFVMTPIISTSSVTNVEFRNCRSNLGGAITVPSGTGIVKVDSCAFVGNSASQNGGAIYTKANSLQVYSSVFSGNSASNYGGAIYAEKQDLYIVGSRFYLNSAIQGAAIFAQDVGLAGALMPFPNNNFTNNTASSQGGAFFADNSASGARSYDFSGCKFDNNCATSPYTDSFAVQVRCSGECTISNKGNSTGCTDIATNIPDTSSDDSHKSNKDRAIIIGVVVPFGILAILSIVLFLYIRKRHNAEMQRRDDYRKKILKALENLPPEEQEAARLEAENADPNAPKCQLCQVRPISTPLPCGHEIVCSVCKTILLECPTCLMSVGQRVQKTNSVNSQYPTTIPAKSVILN